MHRRLFGPTKMNLCSRSRCGNISLDFTIGMRQTNAQCPSIQTRFRCIRLFQCAPSPLSAHWYWTRCKLRLHFTFSIQIGYVKWAPQLIIICTWANQLPTGRNTFLLPLPLFVHFNLSSFAACNPLTFVDNFIFFPFVITFIMEYIVYAGVDIRACEYLMKLLAYRRASILIQSTGIHPIFFFVLFLLQSSFNMWNECFSLFFFFFLESEWSSTPV